jgi:acyl-CoA synthetase (AMP-forming)/AMP-acid ligase II
MVTTPRSSKARPGEYCLTRSSRSAYVAWPRVMAQRGLRKGDVAAILLPNVPEYAMIVLGVAAAGGVVTTVNPLMTGEEIRQQLRDAGAQWLFTCEPFAPRAGEASIGTAVREIFSLGSALEATSFSELLVDCGPPPAIDIAPDDLFALPYSSGTSGLAKGAMITHGNVVSQICQAESMIAGGSRVTVAAVAPFFHILGLILILIVWLRRGATLVALPRFDFEHFLDCVQKYRIKYATLVPPIVLALAKHPLVDKYDLSSFEWIMCGAAPLSGEVEQACAERIGCVVGQGWGMTEISGAGCSIQPSQPQRIRRGACGQLWPGMEARVLDLNTGGELGVGQTGELLVRGPTVTKGYLNRPDANAAAFLDGGWMRTGDVAYFDAEGYLFVVDRIKELIKYNAYQIAPAELEAVLVSHPVVVEAAVIPSPDVEHGEVPKAYVVLKSAITPEALMEFVAERVAPYKKVRKLVIVDAIPKTPAGKLLRRLLVEQDRLTP